MGRTKMNTLRYQNLELLESGQHADVTFLIGPDKEVVKAHKLILLSRSSVFKGIFTAARDSGEKSNVDRPIEIPDTRSGTFCSFLRFIYADEDELEPEFNFTKTTDLLALADKFGVQPLLSKCDRILASKFDLKEMSAMMWYSLARRSSGTMTMSKIEDAIASNFHEFSKTEQFLLLDQDLLTKLLPRDDLTVEEIDLFEALMRWGNKQLQYKENRQRPLSSVLENVLPFIRFPTMTLTKFASVVRPTKLLPDSDMVDIYTYLAATEDQRNQLRGTLKYSAVPRTGQNNCESRSRAAPSGE